MREKDIVIMLQGLSIGLCISLAVATPLAVIPVVLLTVAAIITIGRLR